MSKKKKNGKGKTKAPKPKAVTANAKLIKAKAYWILAIAASLLMISDAFGLTKTGLVVKLLEAVNPF